MTVAVEGPNGRLLTLGSGVDSTLGRLATGSSRIAVRPRALVGVRSGAIGLGVVALLAVAGILAGTTRDRRR